MKFLYPEFLWALLAIAIPIIIHLFSFRRFKKVRFSNVRMIEEVKEETQSRRNLKHLLILLSRIFAIAALVLAFCQPYIPAENVQNVAGQKAVSVYVDNSFSMDAEGEEGNLLELAKQQARVIAGSYEQSDLFQLLTNDFEGRHQRLLNRDDFLKLVDEVKVSPRSKKVSEIISRQQDILIDSEAPGKRAFLISDFQKSAVNPREIVNDSVVRYNFKPMGINGIDNIYIDSVWFRTPVRQLNQNEELTARIVNNSGSSYENLQLNLEINGVQKAISSIDLQPNSVADTTLYFRNTEPGTMSGKVSIEDSPIVYDDDFYFSYKVEENVNILHIHKEDTEDFVSRIFQNDDLFSLNQNTEKNIDYSQFSETNLIILNNVNSISSGLAQELRKFIGLGGSLCIFPGENADLDSFNEFLLSVNANSLSNSDGSEIKVSDIQLNHPLFKDVFERIPRNVNLPTVKKHYAISRRTLSTEQRLLELQNGASFFASYPYEKGKSYLFAVSSTESFSNLPKHALFVTSLLRMAELSLSNNQLYFTIGQESYTSDLNIPNTGDLVLHLRNESSGFDIIPEKGFIGNKPALFFRDQIVQANNYEVTLSDETINGISFNYPRDESELSYYTAEELEQVLKESALSNFQVLSENAKDIATNIESKSEGTRYWKWFVFLALIFLAVEILLIRLK